MESRVIKIQPSLTFNYQLTQNMTRVEFFTSVEGSKPHKSKHLKLIIYNIKSNCSINILILKLNYSIKINYLSLIITKHIKIH